MCVIKEVTGDLFNSTDSLAHCVSEDLHMGAGIAIQFKKRFGKVSDLKLQNKFVGTVALLNDTNRYIFYLVTKQKYWGKPTKEYFYNCIKDLADHCVTLNITKLSIPRLGAGLDKLDWNWVLETIKEVFSSIDITITIYSL